MGYAVLTQCDVLKNGTLNCMARVDNYEGTLITQASVDTVTYTVYQLDEDYPDRPNTRTAVTGHEAVAVAKASCIFNTLQTGGLWSKDSTGYNFRHILDISSNQAFGTAGRKYLVEFTITPTSGQVIKFGFVAEVR